MSKYELQKFKIDSNKLKKNRKIQVKHCNVLSYEDIVINSIQDITNSKEFKFLDIEKRLLLIKDYLNNINIGEDDKNYLIALVKNDKLKNKCDITYDKVNGKILSVKMLEFKEKENMYLLKKKKSSNKHQTSKKLINNLLIS